MDIAFKTIKTWKDFIDYKGDNLSDDWVYRGQSDDYRLTTSLERAQEYFKIEKLDLPATEWQMIRDYRRRFQGEREDVLNKDILYCLALMQHHGAPTRLLDFTWSIYIGAFFALENSKKLPVLWCINTGWIDKAAKSIVGAKGRERWVDKTRNDESFNFMYRSDNPKKFACIENPIQHNTRLIIQQGIFLCPGDISSPLIENLQSMKYYNDEKHILKLILDFDHSERISALKELHRMNITRASLFPGLDGYSQSMKQLMPLYKHMADKKAGLAGS